MGILNLNVGGRFTRGIGLFFVRNIVFDALYPVSALSEFGMKRENPKIWKNRMGEKISKSYKDKERKTLFIVYFYWRISNNCSIMQNIYILKGESREVRNEDCVSGFDSGF